MYASCCDMKKNYDLHPMEAETLSTDTEPESLFPCEQDKILAWTFQTNVN